MIYFQIIENIQKSYLMGVGVEYGPNLLSMSILQLSMFGQLPYSVATSIYGYVNTSSSDLVTSGRNFSVVNYVVKIPPQSLYGYAFEASKRTDFLFSFKNMILHCSQHFKLSKLLEISEESLLAGDVAICKIRITKAGDNIPCYNQFFNTYQVNSNNTKSSDYAIAGPICSISNNWNILSCRN